MREYNEISQRIGNSENRYADVETEDLLKLVRDECEVLTRDLENIFRSLSLSIDAQIGVPGETVATVDGETGPAIAVLSGMKCPPK